jgi:transcriptional regulator with XRE-family HTH domain
MARVRTLVPDGDEIRARRLALGLTPVQLAERLGTGRHPQTIRRLEAGRLEVASEILMHQLALALGAKAEDITKCERTAA